MGIITIESKSIHRESGFVVGLSFAKDAIHKRTWHWTIFFITFVWRGILWFGKKEYSDWAKEIGLDI